MKFLVESEFQGQGPPRTQETTKTTGTTRTPWGSGGTGGPYIASFWDPGCGPSCLNGGPFLGPPGVHSYFKFSVS